MKKGGDVSRLFDDRLYSKRKQHPPLMTMSQPLH